MTDGDKDTLSQKYDLGLCMTDEEFLKKCKETGISLEFIYNLAVLEKIYRDQHWE